MASDEYGTVLEVSTTNLGAVFAASAIVGATTLTLDDVSIFEELGGQVYIDGYTYYYVSVDHDANTMELLVGLIVAATADETRVEIFPPAPHRTAMVAFGIEEGEAVRVAIPHFFSGVPDGVRPSGAQEIALVEERNPGELFLKDVMAKGMTLLGLAENLDDYTSTGNFMQLYDSDAAGGTNYPIPYGGVLEVLSTQPSVIILQRYTAYRTAADAHYPSAWTRAFGAGAWSAWKPVNQTDPVAADLTASGALIPLTTTATLIPGLTINITPPSPAAVYLVLGTVDFSSTSAASASTVSGELFIDSTAEPEQIRFGNTAQESRATPSQNWIISGLSVASHTFQIRAKGPTGVSGYNANATHSTMKIILLSY